MLAVVGAMGMSAGFDLYNKLKNPVERAKIKNKIKTIKDNLTSKTES